MNPGDEDIQVDRDKDLEIRLCTPNVKTKSFGIVQNDWTMLPFDPAGNAKAHEFVRNTGKQREYRIAISGDMAKNIVKVDSIAPEQ